MRGAVLLEGNWDHPGCYRETVFNQREEKIFGARGRKQTEEIRRGE